MSKPPQRRKFVRPGYRSPVRTRQTSQSVTNWLRSLFTTFMSVVISGMAGLIAYGTRTLGNPVATRLGRGIQKVKKVKLTRKRIDRAAFVLAMAGLIFFLVFRGNNSELSPLSEARQRHVSQIVGCVQELDEVQVEYRRVDWEQFSTDPSACQIDSDLVYLAFADQVLGRSSSLHEELAELHEETRQVHLAYYRASWRAKVLGYVSRSPRTRLYNQELSRSFGETAAELHGQQQAIGRLMWSLMVAESELERGRLVLMHAREFRQVTGRRPYGRKVDKAEIGMTCALSFIFKEFSKELIDDQPKYGDQTMKSTTIEKSIGIDLGTNNVAVSYMRTGQRSRQEFSGSGKTIPSDVFVTDDGDALIGVAARNQGMKNPDQLYRGYKRRFPTAADIAFNSGPTPRELTSMFLAQLWALILDANPDFRPYVDGTEDRSKLAIVVTCPATYTTAAQQELVELAKLVGDGFAIDQLIPEPVAAIQRHREEMPQGFKQDDLSAVVDLGGGTADCTLMRYDQGRFDQVIGGKGDPLLGGNDFSDTIFRQIVSEHLPAAVDCFEPDSGFDLGRPSLTDVERRDAFLFWNASEEMKHRLVADETVEEFVSTSTGLKELKLDRATASALFSGGDVDLYERIAVAVADTLLGSTCGWADVKHVFLVGGAAMTVGVREKVAEVTQRDPADIHVCSDSSHAIADGAAYQGLHQEKVARCLPGGFAVAMRDDIGNLKSKFFIGTGDAVPPDGRVVEQLGQHLESQGGTATLALELTEAKPGVRVSGPNGSAVVVADDQVVTLKRVRMPIQLPKGKHEVRLATIVDPGGMLSLQLDFPGLPEKDVVAIPITQGRDDEPVEITAKLFDIIICLDASGSMAGDMEEAREAIYRVLELVASLPVRVGVVQFGLHTRVAAPLGDDIQQIANQVQTIEAGGGTPMGQGLMLAEGELASRTESDRDSLVIVVSDGYPASRNEVEAVAERIKGDSTLAAVAIGAGADEQFLLKIASAPHFYFVAKHIHDLGRTFEQIVELYLDEGTS